MLYTHSTALWWLEGVGVSVPLHSRTHALLSDNTHTHTHTHIRSLTHTHTHFKRSDDAQDAHGPSKQTLLDNFIRTSQSLYPPNRIALLWATHILLPALRVNCCRVCVLVARSWMKERSPCGLLPSDPLLSMKQEIMAEGPRCKRRKQANPRRKNGKKVTYGENPNSGLFSRLNTVGLSEILRCQTKRCTEECGKLSDSVNCSLVCLRMKSTGLKYFHVFKL